MAEDSTKLLASGKKHITPYIDEGSDVQWSVQKNIFKPRDKPPRVSIWAQFTLRDCYKRIDWQFDFDTERQRRARLKKVDAAVKELLKFRAALENATLE